MRCAEESMLNWLGSRAPRGGVLLDCLCPDGPCAKWSRRGRGAVHAVAFSMSREPDSFLLVLSAGNDAVGQCPVCGWWEVGQLEVCFSCPTATGRT